MENNFQDILNFAISNLLSKIDFSLSKDESFFYENILDTALNIENLTDIENQNLQTLLLLLTSFSDKNIKFILLEKELKYKLIRKFINNNSVNDTDNNNNNNNKIINNINISNEKIYRNKPIKNIYKKIIRNDNDISIKIKTITEYEDGTTEESIEESSILEENPDVLTYEKVYNNVGVHLLTDIQTEINNKAIQESESLENNGIYVLE